MEREEYLDQLLAAIKDFPEETQNVILAAFEKVYAQGLISGRKKEAILSTFRTPKKYAEEVKNQYGDHLKASDAERLFVSNGMEFAKYRADFQMAASVLIPLLFVLLIVLHYLKVI